MELDRELFGEWNGGGESPMRTLVVILGVSGLAGLLKYFRSRRGIGTLGGIALSVLTSAFVGMEAHFILRSLGASQDMQFALSGICGYGGGALLDATLPMVIRYCHKRLGIEPPHPRRRASDYAPEEDAENEEEEEAAADELEH